MTCEGCSGAVERVLGRLKGELLVPVYLACLHAQPISDQNVTALSFLT